MEVLETKNLKKRSNRGISCSNHKNLEDCLSNHNKNGEPCGWEQKTDYEGSCNSPTKLQGKVKRKNQIYLCGKGQEGNGIGYDIDLTHHPNDDDYDDDDNDLYVPSYGGKKTKKRRKKIKRKTKRRRTKTKRRMKKIKRKTKRRRKKIKRKTIRRKK